MFVRFRQQGRRLQASMMLTRRVAGKMHTEHIASLGSVDAEVSVRERLAFWAKLPERLARLGNRVGANRSPPERDDPDDATTCPVGTIPARDRIWPRYRERNCDRASRLSSQLPRKSLEALVLSVER
jgi:hypothetical protein